MRLLVYLEREGRQELTGTISATNQNDVIFQYNSNYLPTGVPISISLPLQKGPFDAIKTRCFFDGLLPEGFTRKTVAKWLHTSEEDYLSILSALGKECLGAIRIVDEKEIKPLQSGYVRLTKEQVAELAAEGASKSTELVVGSHLSLTGASGKVGLYYAPEEDVWYQPIGTAPSTHIVKQSHIRFRGIVQNEQLMLQTAFNLGIPTVKSFILQTSGTSDAEILLATERYDREMKKENNNVDGVQCPNRLHQEDFAQALGIPSENKYELRDTHEEKYLKRCFELLRTHSSNPIEDQIQLLDILIFDVLIGNTDNHIKNLSLLYSSDLRSMRLAPAYDLVSTIIYKGSAEDMSIMIGGEIQWKRITREHFLVDADEIGMSKRIIEREYDRLQVNLRPAMDLAVKQLKQQGFTDVERIKEIWEERTRQ